jgi:hypothetical protein
MADTDPETWPSPRPHQPVSAMLKSKLLPAEAPHPGRLPLRAALAAFAALPLALAGCDGADLAADVTAAGVVTNSHGRPVAEATVTFDATDDESDLIYATATTDAEGRFSAALPPGTYTVVAAAAGYNPAGRSLTIGPDGDPDITQTVSGAGVLVAEFVSALTGAGAPGIVLQCTRRLADGSYPDPAVAYDFDAVSDAEGALQVVGAPSGALRCLAEGPGFEARLLDVTVRRDGPTELPPLVITPPPPEGALRLVLTWGEAPNDLDSHLTGPDGTGGRFHVYFASRSYGLTNLDVDDTSSYGPETVTVFPDGVGTYRYSVHNWSDQSPGGSQGIAASPARVEVHDHLGLVCTYEAPDAAQAGNTWRVFETEAPEAGGALAAPCARGERGLPGLGYVVASDAGDLGAFRTGLPPKHP